MDDNLIKGNDLSGTVGPPTPGEIEIINKIHKFTDNTMTLAYSKSKQIWVPITIRELKMYPEEYSPDIDEDKKEKIERILHRTKALELFNGYVFKRYIQNKNEPKFVLSDMLDNEIIAENLEQKFYIYSNSDEKWIIISLEKIKKYLIDVCQYENINLLLTYQSHLIMTARKIHPKNWTINTIPFSTYEEFICYNTMKTYYKGLDDFGVKMKDIVSDLK